MSKLEDIRQTIFRQTMFSEFERQVHGFVEAGTPVTATLLEQTYGDLIRKYYGPSFTVDPDDGLEWAYIPHFYYKYYVYSYATGPLERHRHRRPRAHARPAGRGRVSRRCSRAAARRRRSNCSRAPAST